jgi:glycine betaine/proline transport system permease protein
MVIAVSPATRRKWMPWILLAVGTAALQLLVSGPFPKVWDTLISEPIDSYGVWARSNRQTHPLFTGFLTPLANGVDGAMQGVDGLLNWLPWFVLPLLVGLVVWRLRDWRVTALAVAAMLYSGVVGLWDVTIETLSLMAISVIASVLIGVPLGVWTAFSRTADRLTRPVLDAMQTIPAPVYFIPMLALFGIGRVPAAAATVIYALPPVVRLTALGIRQVPAATVEASHMFGATKRQTLVKVQLPAALPTIMTGVNQTIMMALGIVVLATLLGAGGLGQEVMEQLGKRRPGRGIAVGLAIMAVAIVLDRIGKAVVGYDRTRPFSRRWKWGAVAAVIAAVAFGRLTGWIEYPEITTVKIFDPIDSVVDWAQVNLPWVRSVNDFVIAQVLLPIQNFLISSVSWPVLVFLTAWVSWKLKGPRLAVTSAIMLTIVGLIGLWELSLETLVQVMAAVLLSVLVAIPIGIWAGRRPRVEAVLGPFLDGLQTIPSLVYIIPAVTLITLGPVPGIIASVLYAVVPGIRITSLAIKGVPEESIEASKTFGATPRQTMFGVRIPLAAPTIMAGVNQVIMMVLAMVIIAGLVGGGALGFETIRAVTRSETGLGFEVGFAIVAMAIVLDRLTQAWAERLQPPTAR